MKKNSLVLFLALTLISLSLFSENRTFDKPAKFVVRINVLSKDTGEPTIYASVFLRQNQRKYLSLTDIKGEAIFRGIPNGEYELECKSLGFTDEKRKIIIAADTIIQIILEEHSFSLNEVFVTARSSKGLSTSSSIGKKAIELIQPSSFSDLLELIPGGYAKDPNFSAPNYIRLRESSLGAPGSLYNTTSLGISYEIDGGVIGSEANMGFLNTTSNPGVVGIYIEPNISKGVDARTIATEEIDSVDIIRGIPSVEYGDLTSGLVKIQRIRGTQNLYGRYKSDLKSSLIYLGKGIEFKNKGIKLNGGLSYLSYNDNPITVISGYSRLVSNIRVDKSWVTEKYATNLYTTLDFSQSLKDKREDKEINYGKQNTYKDEYKKLALMFDFSIKSKKSDAFFKSLTANISVSGEKQLRQHNFFYSVGDGFSTPNFIFNKMESGVYDLEFLSPAYFTYEKSEGLPFYSFIKTKTQFGKRGKNWSDFINIGADWKLYKNFGNGISYDPQKPPQRTIRPWGFKEIPAEHILGGYLENVFNFSFYKWEFTLQTGLRATTLLNLPQQHILNGKIYLEPRVNGKIKIPEILIAGKPLNLSIIAGFGNHYKFPTLAQIYPEKEYHDFNEFTLTAQSIPQKAKRLRFRTYVEDVTNYELQPAKNQKQEIRLDIEYKNYEASLVCFTEELPNGFRAETLFKPFYYERYKIPPGYPIEDKPIPLEDLEKEELNSFSSYTFQRNGSRTYKKGVEYSFNTPRFSLTKTRFSIIGAWFYNEYRNSDVVMRGYLPKQYNLQVKYVGYYFNATGYNRWSSNTNFNMDVWVPSLDFNFMLSAQFHWTAKAEVMSPSNSPFQFMDLNGTIKDYTMDEISKDTELRELYRAGSDPYFQTEVPMGFDVNIKVSKSLFEKKATVSAFATRIYSYQKEKFGYTSEVPSFGNPYFGIELNIKL